MERLSRTVVWQAAVCFFVLYLTYSAWGFFYRPGAVSWVEVTACALGVMWAAQALAESVLAFRALLRLESQWLRLEAHASREASP